MPLLPQQVQLETSPFPTLSLGTSEHSHPHVPGWRKDLKHHFRGLWLLQATSHAGAVHGLPWAAERSQAAAKLHLEHLGLLEVSLSCLGGVPRDCSIYKRAGMPSRAPSPYTHVHIDIHPPKHRSCDPKIIIPHPDTTSANVQHSSSNFCSSLGQELQASGSQDTSLPISPPYNHLGTV